MIVINQFSNESPVADISFPIGAITMWYGLISEIPSGYIVCNGLNGTPNIKDRFVKGASNSTELLTTEGASTHLHTGGGVSNFAHDHSISSFNTSGEATYHTAQSGTGATAAAFNHYHTVGGANTSMNNHTHAQTGVSSTASSMPPYKSLHWIKRIS